MAGAELHPRLIEARRSKRPPDPPAGAASQPQGDDASTAGAASQPQPALESTLRMSALLPLQPQPDISLSKRPPPPQRLAAGAAQVEQPARPSIRSSRSPA